MQGFARAAQMLEHVEQHDGVATGIGQRQLGGVGEDVGPGAVARRRGRGVIDGEIVAARRQGIAHPFAGAADVDHEAARLRQQGPDRLLPAEQPLRMQGSPPQPRPARGAGLRQRDGLVYVSDVICSETSPMRNTITDALNNNRLMLVKRPCVLKVQA